ncbi:MAG: glutamate racemase [Methylotenera sp.]|nr:glutamate racemase [Oligoflexia bacterium]
MIGVFDSGFGGLTIFKSLLERMPEYDYLYLGDSARSPYGARSMEVVHKFTRESVEWLFEQGCELVVLACNTASAKALKNIQQLDLPARWPDRRVLGVIRPSVEALVGIPPATLPAHRRPDLTGGSVAVLATRGTVLSNSYAIEAAKLAPGLNLIQQACPLWVPLIEAGELSGVGTEHFVRHYLDPLFKGPDVPKRILLACTHYPLLYSLIRQVTPPEIEVISQGEIIAHRLEDWLRRHGEMDRRLSRGQSEGTRRYATTDDVAWFAEHGERILGCPIQVENVELQPVEGGSGITAT